MCWARFKKIANLLTGTMVIIDDITYQQNPSGECLRVFRQLVSGNPMEAEPKGSMSTTMYNQLKVILGANSLFSIKDAGVLDRLVPVIFDHPFPRRMPLRKNSERKSSEAHCEPGYRRTVPTLAAKF